MKHRTRIKSLAEAELLPPIDSRRQSRGASSDGKTLAPSQREALKTVLLEPCGVSSPEDRE